MFIEPLSGNTSDKKTLLRNIEEVRNNLVTDETIYHMTDSAFYTAKNIGRLGQQCYWITHVPESIKEAKFIIQSNPEWNSCQDPRYKYAVFNSSYGEISQRWVLFRSSEQYKGKLETYDQNKQIKLKKDQTALHKLCVKGFACEADARKTVEQWLATHPRYRFEHLDISAKHRRKSG